MSIGVANEHVEKPYLVAPAPEQVGIAIAGAGDEVLQGACPPVDGLQNGHGDELEAKEPIDPIDSHFGKRPWVAHAGFEDRFDATLEAQEIILPSAAAPATV